MNNEKMGFIDYVFLALFLAMLFIATSCSKDTDCNTTQIGSIEKIINKNGVNEISYSPIYETICL